MLIEYNLRFETSTYHACEAYGNLYVAGSMWDRRKVLYTKKIAEQSGGVLRILSGGEVKKEIFFPHMAYTVTDLLDGRLFVACKYAAKAFTLINKDGEILQQRDDEIGQGSYAVIYDSPYNEILLATRAGKLEILDASDLRTKNSIRLASLGTRLWALCNSDNRVYATDYDGMIYLLERVLDREKFMHFDTEKLHFLGEFNVGTLYSEDNPRVKQGFKPAVWGLEVLPMGKILAGTRWGNIFLLDRYFRMMRFCDFKEDVTSIRKVYDDLFLVGTRYGKIYSFDPIKFKRLELVIEIKPCFQKENAVWTMTPTKDGILACFADGHVVKLLK